jgi:NADH:ubiquinone oxidoreductase subunit 2 (subunit N)
LALAIIGVANAAIAAAYYLRVVATMYFRAPESAAHPVTADMQPAEQRRQFAPALAMTLALILVILAGVFPGGVMERSDDAGAAVSTAPRRQNDSPPVAFLPAGREE